MTFEQPAKRSLGSLPKATKTKERSPDLTRTMKLQHHTMEAIAKQFKETDADSIECCLAGWGNTDSNGERCLTVELTPQQPLMGR